MKSWFEIRSYPNKLIAQEMDKMKFLKNGNVVRQRDPTKGCLPLNQSFNSAVQEKWAVIWLERNYIQRKELKVLKN